MKKTWRRVTLLGLIAAGAGCEREGSGVRVNGSTGVMPLVAELARAYGDTRPAAPVELGSGMGSGERIQALAEGRIDIAMASHGLNVEEITLQGLAIHEIARGAVVFAVHAGVPVTDLSEAQICDIYAGRITNWSDVGGPDLPIAPRVRPDTEVDAEVVRDRIGCWADLEIAPTVQRIEDPSEMARSIAGTPGAIGLTSMPLVEQTRGGARALSLGGIAPDMQNVGRGTYPLIREFFLVTHGSPSDAVTGFLNFVRSDAGDRVIRTAGAVPTG